MKKTKNASDATPPVGRPPMEFNEVYADMLCGEIATCPESLAKIVARLQGNHAGFPSIPTIYRWIREDSEFAEEYAQAKQDQSDLLVDEMMEICDDESGDKHGSTAVQRAKLRVETRKWIASKLKPKSYGDRLDLNANIDHKYSVTALFKQIVSTPSLVGVSVPDDIEYDTPDESHTVQ